MATPVDKIKNTAASHSQNPQSDHKSATSEKKGRREYSFGGTFYKPAPTSVKPKAANLGSAEEIPVVTRRNSATESQIEPLLASSPAAPANETPPLKPAKAKLKAAASKVATMAVGSAVFRSQGRGFDAPTTASSGKKKNPVRPAEPFEDEAIIFRENGIKRTVDSEERKQNQQPLQRAATFSGLTSIPKSATVLTASHSTDFPLPALRETLITPSPEKSPHGTPRLEMKSVGSDQPVVIPKKGKSNSGSNTPTVAGAVATPTGSPRPPSGNGTPRIIGTLPLSGRTETTPRKITPPSSTISLSQVPAGGVTPQLETPAAVTISQSSTSIEDKATTPRKITPPPSDPNLIPEYEPAAPPPPVRTEVSSSNESSPKKGTPPSSNLNLQAPVLGKSTSPAASPLQLVATPTGSPRPASETPRKGTPPSSTLNLQAPVLDKSTPPAASPLQLEATITGSPRPVSETPRKMTPPSSTLNLQAPVLDRSTLPTTSTKPSETIHRSSQSLEQSLEERKTPPPTSKNSATKPSTTPAISAQSSPLATPISLERAVTPETATLVFRNQEHHSPNIHLATPLPNTSLTTDDSKEPSPAGTLRKKKTSAPLFDSSSMNDFSKYGKDLAEMMKEAIEGARTGAPLEPVAVYTPREAVATQPLKMPKEIKSKIKGESLDVSSLNALFPNKKSETDQRISNNDREMEIMPLLPTPEEIQNLVVSQEEIKGVKTLNLFGTSISDKQLRAIVRKFPSLQRVALLDCSNVTDWGIASLADLKGLKSVEIRFCTRITEKGIQVIPLSQLEEFELSTEAPVTESIVTQLAASKVLRKVNFDLCARLTPAALLCLRGAHQLFPISISTRECDQIPQETIEEINRGRTQPISVLLGTSDPYDTSLLDLRAFMVRPSQFTQVAESRRALVPPPEIPEADDILSTKSLPEIFDLDTQKLPHPSVIEENNYTKNRPNFEGFRGFNLTGRFSNDSLNALIRKFPNMEIARIWDNSELTTIELLKELHHLKVLYLGKILGIPWRRFEILFSKDGHKKGWEQLTEIHLSGIPITDRVLSFLSGLPNLKEITFSHCDSLTMRGLKDLMRSDSLQKLSVIDCLGIDPFAVEVFRKIRPSVALTAELTHDPSVSAMAIEEAEERIKINAATRFIFYPELANALHPNKEKIDQFYAEKLNLIGIEFQIDETGDLRTQWMKYDQILQAYVNIHRSCWMIRQKLIEVGFFTPMDKEKPPYTAQELIQYIDPAEEENLFKTTGARFPLTANERRRKVKDLDFSHLELTYIPRFIEKCGYWEQVGGINLAGNYIAEAPAPLKQLCPNTLKEADVPSLSLQKRPGLTSKMVDDLFLKDRGPDAWRELTAIDAKDIPLSDEAMGGIASLPKLETLDLVGCKELTARGLKYLEKGCSFLKKLSLLDSPGIDPFAVEEFQKARPGVELQVVPSLDPYAKDLAIQEANRRIELPKESNRNCFIPEHNKHPNIQTIALFYNELLGKIGSSFALDELRDIEKQFMWADQVLQGYKNLHRSCWAIRKELIRVGAFKDKEPPSTVKELIELLNTPSETGAHYGSLVETLDLSDLDLTYIPQFIEEAEWPKVESINFKGNWVETPSERLISHCPLLLKKEERAAQLDEIGADMVIADQKEEPPSPPSKLKEWWKKLRST